MPQAIFAVLPYVVGALGATQGVVTAVAIASAVASVAVTAAEQKQAASKAKRRAREYPRNATLRSGVVPRNIIYGKAQVGGPLTFAKTVHTSGSNNNTDLWIVQALCGHEVEDIEDVWVDDKFTTDAQITSGLGGAVLSGSPFYNGGALAYFYRRFGTATQSVISELQTAFTASSEITSSFRGRGVAYLACRFILANNSRNMFTGVPQNIRALVKGKRVYDPRRDPASGYYTGTGSQSISSASTWEWSDNPALCVADYLMDSKYGMRVASTRIDWSLVATSATYCEATVSTPGGNEERFTCNGVLSCDTPHGENIDAILSSMAGTLTLTGGKYRIRANMWEAPVGSLTDNDVGDNVRFRPRAPKRERANTVRAKIYDAARGYQELDAGEMTLVAT